MVRLAAVCCRLAAAVRLRGAVCARLCRLFLSKHDTVSEWLRRWTRNPLGSARRGSNPLGVDCLNCVWAHKRQGDTDLNSSTSLYSSVAERQSCKLKVLGSIPSGGFFVYGRTLQRHQLPRQPRSLPGRLELPTLRLTASRSNQLSYGSQAMRQALRICRTMVRVNRPRQSSAKQNKCACGACRPHRLVARTSRCGRDNPGSTPGAVIVGAPVVVSDGPPDARQARTRSVGNVWHGDSFTAVKLSFVRQNFYTSAGFEQGRHQVGIGALVRPEATAKWSLRQGWGDLC